MWVSLKTFKSKSVSKLEAFTLSMNGKSLGFGSEIVCPFEINSIPRLLSIPIPKSIVLEPPVPRT